MKYKFIILVDQDEDGTFIAEVPALKGCHTYGATLDELYENLEEAIALHIERAEELNNGPLQTSVPNVEYFEIASPHYA